MSKAFTRESDDLPERPTPPRSRPVFSPVTKSSLTPDGADRFRVELEHLLNQRQSAASPSSGPSSPPIRVNIEQRIADLQRLLKTAQIVLPPPTPHDQVRFGAWVSVRDSAGDVFSYRIVGTEEADPDRDWISFQSPLAKALSGARLGGSIVFNAPTGPRSLEIVSIRFV